MVVIVVRIWPNCNGKTGIHLASLPILRVLGEWTKILVPEACRLSHLRLCTNHYSVTFLTQSLMTFKALGENVSSIVPYSVGMPGPSVS